jgi:hypothetical protein
MRRRGACLRADRPVLRTLAPVGFHHSPFPGDHTADGLFVHNPSPDPGNAQHAQRILLAGELAA